MTDKPIVQDTKETLLKKTGQAVENVKEKAGELADKAKESELAAKAKELADKAKESELAEKAKEKIGDLKEGAKDLTGKIGGKLPGK